MAARNKTTARLIGAGDKASRQKDDFYATPPCCTKALLEHEDFFGAIWEPACGQGHISRVLKEDGRDVISTDLVDRGYGTARVDFLMEQKLLAPNIITNPPFKYAHLFAEKALQLGAVKVAMLCKTTFLNCANRSGVIDNAGRLYNRPLARVRPFINRVALWKDGIVHTGGMLDLAWFIWELDHCGLPEIERIRV